MSIYLASRRCLWHVYHWVRFRLMLWVPFLRPQWFTVKAPVCLSMRTVVAVDSKSFITLSNVSIKGSVLTIARSQVSLSNARINDCRVHISDSEAAFEKETAIIHSYVNLRKASWATGQYFLLQGTQSQYLRLPTSIAVNNGSFRAGRNVLIEACIDIDEGEFSIGDNACINAGTEIRCHNRITIGSNVLLSYECIIFDTNTHSTDYRKRQQEFLQGFPNSTLQTADLRPVTKPIAIGDDVWIGMRAVLLKGSRVGDRSIVALGSVVTGEVSADSLAYGNPSKVKELGAKTSSAG